MGFFQERPSLKKSILKHFFISLLKDLSMKDLVTLGNLLSTKFMEPSIWLYATPSRRAWVPQYLKNKVLKQHVNCWMIGTKPRDVYDSRKKRNLNNWSKNQHHKHNGSWFGNNSRMKYAFHKFCME